MSSARITHVHRDGIILTCTARGETGPPVLMLHGLAGSADEITEAVAGFVPGHRVQSWDQRGHGRSTRGLTDVSRDAHVADAVAVIEHLADEPVTLVGQSLGGHTAMLVAARRPDLVTSLVIAEASPERNPDGADDLRSWLADWPLPFASRAAAHDHFLTRGYFHSGNAARVWSDDLEEHSDGWRPRFDTDIMVESLREVTQRDYWTEWERITCPTLVVRGEHGIVADDLAARMTAAGPKTDLVTIADAGHDVHLDQPEAWCRTLQRWLPPPHR